MHPRHPDITLRRIPQASALEPSRVLPRRHPGLQRTEVRTAHRTRSLRQLRLHEPGYALPLQLWIQAWKHGLTVTELPVDLIYRDLSRAFVGSIADAERRLAYHNAIINRELARP